MLWLDLLQNAKMGGGKVAINTLLVERNIGNIFIHIQN
jgi:hypothetical protein